MVTFILTFDLKVSSVRVIKGSKRSNLYFSVKSLNRMQNLSRNFNDVFSFCVR